MLNLPNKRMTLRTESWLNECLYLKAMAANIQWSSSGWSESHSTAQLTRARRVQIWGGTTVVETQTIGHLFVQKIARNIQKYGFCSIGLRSSEDLVWKCALLDCFIYVWSRQWLDTYMYLCCNDANLHPRLAKRASPNFA